MKTSHLGQVVRKAVAIRTGHGLVGVVVLPPMQGNIDLFPGSKAVIK